MAEVWKPVDGYAGFYEVSSLGRIRGIDRITANGKRIRGKIIKPQHDSKGNYLMVSLNKDGKKKSLNIHRLVAIAFIPNPKGFGQINHKDENKRNNAASNLEWCSASYNINYGSHNSKVAEKHATAVIQYDAENNIIASYKSHREASRKTGIPQGSISHVVAGKRKTAGGFVWKNA